MRPFIAGAARRAARPGGGRHRRAHRDPARRARRRDAASRLRIALATHNPHKLRELATDLRRLAGRLGQRREPRPAAFPDVEETGETYLDNARLKARAVATALGLPALADDSGIEVDALGGRPGPRSARYAGEHATDEENLRALIQGDPGDPGSRPDGAVPVRRGACVTRRARSCTPTAVCEGTLRTSPAGSGGFGYDPIFVPVGWDVTMAELTDEQKDRISHRGRAFRALPGAPGGRLSVHGATELKVARPGADVPSHEGAYRAGPAAPWNRRCRGSSVPTPGPFGIVLSIVFVITVGVVDHFTGPGRVARAVLPDAGRARDADRRPRVGARIARARRPRDPARGSARGVQRLRALLERDGVVHRVRRDRVARRRARRDRAEPGATARARDRTRRRPAPAERHAEHVAPRGVARPEGTARRRARRDADDPPRGEAAPDRQGDGTTSTG